MKNAFRFVSVVLVLTSIQLPAQAADEREPIVGVVVPGQPIDLYYPNQLEPPPCVKVLQFTGDATVLPGGPDGLLEIFFDYINDQGVEVFPALGQTLFPIQAGAGPVPVNVGPVTLPYCPPMVSIHIRSLEEPGFGAPIELNGVFGHACITVPEPSTWVLGMCGVLGLIAVATQRRRGRRAI